MADIWGNIGVEIDRTEGEWLVRQGAEVRGPMPHRQVVERLVRGEFEMDTPVAREGTDFHPINKVSAFAAHLEGARRARVGRLRARQRRLAAVTVLPLLLAAGGAVAYGMHARRLALDTQRRVAAQVLAERAAAKARQQQAEASLPAMDLVALVSLGTERDVTIKAAEAPPPAPKKARPAHRAERRAAVQEGPAEPEAPEEEVQTCKLTQNDIFGVLRASLGKLNVCVEDEKKRDTSGQLPPSLELQFVVKPSGRVADFLIGDRHYRTGPLNNCLIKAFQTLSFPVSTGANCPVTIPIKIGK